MARPSPRPHPTTPADPVELDRRLAGFEAPYLREKLLAEGVFETPDEFEAAFAEFKRYAALATTADGPLPMTSAVVDAVWHQFILFTREYEAFCRTQLGRFLHHRPHTSLTPPTADGPDAFVAAYTRAFGPPPGIWADAAECDECGGCGGGCQVP